MSSGPEAPVARRWREPRRARDDRAAHHGVLLSWRATRRSKTRNLMELRAGAAGRPGRVAVAISGPEVAAARMRAVAMAATAAGRQNASSATMVLAVIRAPVGSRTWASRRSVSHVYWTRQAVYRGPPAADFEAERIEWISLSAVLR